MLYGLEIRSPFLSREIVYYANSLKIKNKFTQSTNTSKAILKLMAKEKKLIPDKIIKQKIGFNSDIDDWLRQ